MWFAGRIEMGRLHKETPQTFGECVEELMKARSSIRRLNSSPKIDDTDLYLCSCSFAVKPLSAQRLFISSLFRGYDRRGKRF